AALDTPMDLAGILARVGERVQAYYERAQSIICTETINYEWLDTSLSFDPRNRRLTYDLRMSWEKAPDGDVPEGTALRTLKTVNGRPPKPNDEAQCLDPKPTAVDTLSFLLPQHQHELTFVYKGIGKAGDGHSAVMIEYTPTSKDKPKFTWNDSCFAIDAPTRTRGRIWIDRFSGDVLRVDETISGPLDVDVPRTEQRRSGVSSIVLDRSDFSIRYKMVTFSDPSEYVLLPESIEYMSTIRGQPRQRTTHRFSGYQRFVTGGRLLGQ
ncbi:MAG TPA: hypothetical protein VLV86_18340, partial [Vicinamibacterales bacterium]|nr:hypothetical protein [Vicinamibacterales bacterium]